MKSKRDYKMKACYVYVRPKKKNKWAVFNTITQSNFYFRKKRHAYLVADCLNQIYTKELVDIFK